MYSSPSEDRCKAHWLHPCGQNGQFQLQTRCRFRINLSKSKQPWEVTWITWIHDTFMKKGWVSDELKLLKGLLEGSTLRQWIQGEVAGVKCESEILTRLEAISTFGESNSRIWVPGWAILCDYVWFINTFKKRWNIVCIFYWLWCFFRHMVVCRKLFFWELG